MGTLLIKNGFIVDGSGNAGFPGQLLIDGETIAGVFKDGEAVPGAEQTVDAAGCAVTPGFIDMHSHSEWLLPLPDHDIPLRCLPEQGVTTIVGGNCGFSPAPVTENIRQLAGMGQFSLLVDRPLDFQWGSVGDFFERVDDTRPVVNLAMLAGHGSIRMAHAATRRGGMPADEMRDCGDRLRHCLDDGACGLSFGLGYDPGMYSPPEELEAFSKVAAAADKPVTVHLKALSRVSPVYPLTYLKAHNLRALKEMIDVSRASRARLQISHFIFVGRRSWSTAETAIAMVEEARRSGLDVMFDAFPYTCGNTTVNVLLPYWYLAGLPEAYHRRWPRLRLKAELALGFKMVGFSLQDLQMMDAILPEWESLNGHRVNDIAEKWGVSPFQTFLSLSEKSQGQAVGLLHAYSGEPGNEQVLEDVLSHDLCLFETDAIIRYGGYPNPAAMGTFPKILGKYVRDRKLLSLTDAVRRITSAAADRFHIKDRGLLAPGKKADITIFDPDEIDDTPAADSAPAGRPKGIRRVFINGVPVVEDGRYLEKERVGQVIRV